MLLHKKSHINHSVKQPNKFAVSLLKYKKAFSHIVVRVVRHEIHPFNIKAVMLDTPDLLPNFMCVTIISEFTFAQTGLSLSRVVMKLCPSTVFQSSRFTNFERERERCTRTFCFGLVS